MVVVSDNNPCRPEIGYEKVGYVRAGVHSRELPCKRDDDNVLYARSGNEFQFFIKWGQQLQRLIGKQQLARMRLKRDQYTFPVFCLRMPYQLIQDHTVPQVHTVESTDRKHGIPEIRQ